MSDSGASNEPSTGWLPDLSWLFGGRAADQPAAGSELPPLDPLPDTSGGWATESPDPFPVSSYDPGVDVGSEFMAGMALPLLVAGVAVAALLSRR